MPFGSIFAALFFGVVCGAIGLRFALLGPPALRVAGVLLAVLGGSLAAGLLLRRGWARWLGASAGLLLAASGARLVAERGQVVEHVLVLAALVAATLLVVPATGDPRRGVAPEAAAATRRVGAPGWTALASGLGLVALGLSVEPPATGSSRADATALPAAALGRSVSWSAFGPGLERARAEGKPVLATFITDWCPYCTKMARNTWRASLVVERLDRVVPVRVDVEATAEAQGPPGPELAERYGVRGFPAQLLLDPAGRVIARYDGYQDPRQLTAWLDDALGGPPSGALAALPGGRP